MDDPAEDNRGQEDGMTTVDRMAYSSLMEDSRAVQFNVGDGHREDEHITQVSDLFRSFCNFTIFLKFQHLSVMVIFLRISGSRDYRHRFTYVWISGE
jgi:hypothetical protein